MHVHFWGVRGSIASPGPETNAVGGNTSCIEVVCGDRRIVLDAGTGLRGLGNRMLARGEPLALTLLLSHYHWDHIQGLPFFVPVYMKETELAVVGGKSGVMSAREALASQMRAPLFPVRFEDAGARITTREVDAGDVFEIGDALVKVARGNHPGGVVAYRIEHEGKSLVYATDTEHEEGAPPSRSLVELAEGADLFVYDAQYTPEEYPKKVGWGHSTYVAGAEIARSAGVGTLVLFHHDPSRGDAGVAELEYRARSLYAPTIAAREGLTLDLEPGARPGRRAA